MKRSLAAALALAFLMLMLAFMCAAPLFSPRTLERWLRGLLLLYGVLALISAAGFLTGSLLSLLGPVA